MNDYDSDSKNAVSHFENLYDLCSHMMNNMVVALAHSRLCLEH